MRELRQIKPTKCKWEPKDIRKNLKQGFIDFDAQETDQTKGGGNLTNVVLTVDKVPYHGLGGDGKSHGTLPLPVSVLILIRGKFLDSRGD